MNNWLDENRKQIDYYINSKDIILIERKKHMELMLDIFSSCFPDRKDPRFLDVGCGDGALTMFLRDFFPDNSFHLLNGSATMLDREKKNISAEKAVFYKDAIQNFFASKGEENYYAIINTEFSPFSGA